MKCEGCKFYVFTHTISSFNEPTWHCRFGLSPKVSDLESCSCVSEAESILQLRRFYYNKHPEDLQLKIPFNYEV